MRTEGSGQNTAVMAEGSITRRETFLVRVHSRKRLRYKIQNIISLPKSKGTPK